ncbi:GIY-YIG nuclease family protein [Ruegeria sp. HKCCD7318]|uniref:GIY-YIG nuclease family protein n=1 Tax=Ruegeria sp. HKCCD7318 TaxID=2683014 RepID=UPI0014928A60|nr:GIY-YIG nuclease family protein [Ruegeria sp. HKCCD7318]NOE32306.1 hypothetical protein [Ruegeria sp. HKCCD7318]
MSDIIPNFDFTHGKSSEQRRDPDVFLDATRYAKVRPEKGGRKVVALFEAQNPNGLLSRLRARSAEVPTNERLDYAVEFLEKFGGSNCISSWPSVTELNDALSSLEQALGEEPAAISDEYWSDDELGACLQAYLEMLRCEQNGVKYSKSEFNRNLRDGALKDRSKGSVEFRMQNLSAFFSDQGMPTIDGYKPRGNVGAVVSDRLVALLTNNDKSLHEAAEPKTDRTIDVHKHYRPGPAPHSGEYTTVATKADVYFVYVLELSNKSVLKVGFSSDPLKRLDDYNHKILPEISGLSWKLAFKHPLPTAEAALEVEQTVLNRFNGRRLKSNGEVLEGVSAIDIQLEIIAAVRSMAE